MSMEGESSVIVQKALKLIEDTRKIAMQIVINKADFMILAYYLFEVRPLFEELSKQQKFLRANSASLQRLANTIESIHAFTKACASRSRIFMLCRSGELVNEMTKYFEQLAECLDLMLTDSVEISPVFEHHVAETREKVKGAAFFQEPSHTLIAEEITSSIQCQSDEELATDLLQKIAEHLKVPGLEAAELKLELEKDLEIAESEGREADVEELRGLCALLNPAQVLDFKRKLAMENSPLHPLGTPQIPKPFYCPITKELMREPVMLEEGHSYEKAAILEWLGRGNKTSPNTGQELRSLELIPNVKLLQAMDEFFSNMYKGQLVQALQRLRMQNSVPEIEAAITLVKEILDVDEKYRRLLVSLDGIRPLVSVLKPLAPQMKGKILRILYNVAVLGDDFKLSIVEAEAIPVLLKMLQRSPGENGGPVQLLWELSKVGAGLRAMLSEKGSVLVIASAFNLCQNDQKLLAEKLLGNLCKYDDSVIVEVARSGLYGPLVTSLTSGDEQTRCKMATAISNSLELNDHSSSALVREGVLVPLLNLLRCGSDDSKIAAGSALHRLSDTDMNRKAFAKACAIPVLVKFLESRILQLRIDIMAVLSNLATDRQNAVDIDREGVVMQHLSASLSGDSLIREYSLKTLQCMAKDSHSVRTSVKDLKVVPSIYQLLRSEGLSKNCRASILNILCHLAEDSSTRQALITSQEMVSYLIGLMEENMTAEENEAMLGFLAGLSNLDEMRPRMLLEGQLLSISAEHLKARESPKLQESAAVILSRLCDPTLMESSVQMHISRQGLITSLVGVIRHSSSTERAKQHAAFTLALFSKCTPGLTQRQSCLKRLLARLGFKKYRTCKVHAGKCDVKGSYCIVEAGAVPSLIDLVKEGGPSSADQALETLCTLLENTENFERGVQCLVNNGIISPLVSLVGKSDGSTEKAAKMLEFVFRIKRFRDDHYSKPAKASLARILTSGNANARSAAAIALMHLNEVARDSTYAFAPSI